MNTSRPTFALRKLLRHVSLHGLAAWERGRQALANVHNPCVQFLLLHHVDKHEVAGFCRILDMLSREYCFVSYSEAYERIRSGNVDKKYLAFSFDDGQKSCLTATRILEGYGATAAFFVCPDIVGETDRSKIARFCREQLRHDPVDFLDWKDLEELIHRGHEVGGHTSSHCNLGQAPTVQVEHEINGCFEAISRRLGRLKHFAWPYGRWEHMSEHAVETTFKAGFESCASGERGAHGGFPGIGNSIWDRCLYRQSIEAVWPTDHVWYFLRRAERILPSIDRTPSRLAA